jgi:hypothetical protein
VKPRVFIAVVAILAAGIASNAQDQFKTARDLYTSAAYEEALSALTLLHTGTASSMPAERVDQYRAFCLFALGRSAEAQAVAEALIERNPLIELDTSDASPRIAAMFTDVRKRLLPRIIREQYRLGRAAVERKDFVGAEPQLLKVGQMIDEAAKIDAADETMADLRVLTDGFLELARSAKARAAQPSLPSATAPAGDHAPAASAAPASAGDATPAIYTASSADITAPIVVHQEFPVVPRALANVMVGSDKRGIVDVLIDERGDVERVTIRESLNSMYDRLVVNTARRWKYQPALKSGTPVKFLKSIGMAVKEAPASGQPDPGEGITPLF